MKHYHHHHVGAPLGNQNARKHGFYSKILTADQLAQLPRLAAARGLEHEIEVMRVKLYSIQEHTPDNHPLQFRVVRLLNRMVNSQEKLDHRAARKIRSLVRKYMPGEIYGIGGTGRPAVPGENYEGIVSRLLPYNTSNLASNCFFLLPSPNYRRGLEPAPDDESSAFV